MVKERLEICEQCEKYNNDTKRCIECHCHMPSKALVPFADCPLDKWPKNFFNKLTEQL